MSGSVYTRRYWNIVTMPISSTGSGAVWIVHPYRQKGDSAIGPNPTDRGRPGTKRHLLTDRQGVPLAALLYSV